MSLELQEVDASTEEEFFRVRQRALGGLPNWRPGPRAWEAAFFDESVNPLFRHIDAIRYVALSDGLAIGRIVAWVDDRDPTHGFFGFFDLVDDLEAGRLLAEAAMRWCGARGRVRIRGPIDFWAICSAGVPVSGFDLPNTFSLHHGNPAYAPALELAGLTPVSEIYSWQFGERAVPPPAEGIARATLADPAISLRAFDASSVEHWELAEELYTSCYAAETWFAPMSADELRLVAGGCVDEAISFLVFVHGTPAAIAVALSNVTESSVRVGDLVVPEPVQRVARATRRPTSFRQWLFGVAPPFRDRRFGHLGTAMYVTIRHRAAEEQLERGEAAWTSKIEGHLVGGFTALGVRRDKTYRVFEAPLPRAADGP